MNNKLQRKKEVRSVIQKGKSKDCHQKIKSGLIIYRSEKCLRKNIKHGLASAHLNYEDYPLLDQRKDHYRMLKLVEKSTVRHLEFSVVSPEESKLNSLLLISSRIRSLQKISVAFEDISPESNPGMRKFIKKVLKYNKRVQILSAQCSKDFILASNIKLFSLLNNLKSLEIGYNNYLAIELSSLLNILSNALKNIYKRRIWKQLTNQHYDFDLDPENLRDSNSLFAHNLNKLNDVTKQVKTEFSFKLNLGDLPAQDLTNFQQVLKKINNVRSFIFWENTFQDLNLVFGSVNNHYIRILAISFPENSQQNESFSTSFSNLMKEMSFLIHLIVNLGNLSTEKLLNLFAINMSELTTLPRLGLIFTKENATILTDDLLNNFAKSLRKLEILEHLSLNFVFQNLSNSSFSFSSLKSLLESLRYLKKLQELEICYTDKTLKFDGLLESLCCSLKMLRNLEFLHLHFPDNKIGEPEISQLARTFPYLEKIHTVHICFDTHKATNQEILNLFHCLSSIDSVFSLTISLHIKNCDSTVASKLFKYLNPKKDLKELNLIFYHDFDNWIPNHVACLVKIILKIKTRMQIKVSIQFDMLPRINL